MSGAEEPQWKEFAKIRGREAQAIVVAVREFEKHKRSKTDKGERGDVVQVGFSPDIGPIDRKERTVGGGTQYGIETYYEVSLKTLKILRQTFAR